MKFSINLYISQFVKVCSCFIHLIISKALGFPLSQPCTAPMLGMGQKANRKEMDCSQHADSTLHVMCENMAQQEEHIENLSHPSLTVCSHVPTPPKTNSSHCGKPCGWNYNSAPGRSSDNTLHAEPVTAIFTFFSCLSPFAPVWMFPAALVCNAIGVWIKAFIVDYYTIIFMSIWI